MSELIITTNPPGGTPAAPAGERPARPGAGPDLAVSVGVGVALTAASYAVAVARGWIAADTLDPLEVFAVFTSYSCTWLCVKERRINYPIGAVSCAAYALLFLRADLIASAVLNLYLAPYLVYGWVRWRRDEITRPVTRIRPVQLPGYVAVGLVGWAGAVALSRSLGGALAGTDSVVLAGTLLAQFLLDNKKLENWIVWAVVNVFAIYTYATSGLPLVALQYVFFLGNTVFGYATWRRSWKAQR